MLATTFLWTTGRNFVMVSCANSLRLGEELGRNRRPLFWIIVLALVVAVGGAVWMVMLLSHKYGAINLWIWSGGNLRLCGEAPPHPNRLLRLGLGQYGDWRGDYDRVDGRALALRVVCRCIRWAT